MHRFAGRAEQKRIGRREKLFNDDNTRCGRKKSRCSRHRVDGVVVNDEDKLLETWAAHFRELGESRVGIQCGLQE